MRIGGAKGLIIGELFELDGIDTVELFEGCNDCVDGFRFCDDDGCNEHLLSRSLENLWMFL